MPHDKPPLLSVAIQTINLHKVLFDEKFNKPFFAWTNPGGLFIGFFFAIQS